jgi:hypothetical protein
MKLFNQPIIDEARIISLAQSLIDNMIGQNFLKMTLCFHFRRFQAANEDVELNNKRDIY